MIDQTDKKTKKRKRSIVDRLAERLGIHASAKAVYSDPIEHDGVTVIPVAKVRFGFGGGSGRKPGKGGEGGGGGMKATPLGYIELKEGQAQFKPIRDPAALVPLVAVGGLAGWILLRSVRKLLRG